MAVLVVWASPNKNGLTASCKDMVIQGISSAGKEYVKVHLNLQDVQRCRVCDLSLIHILCLKNDIYPRIVSILLSLLIFLFFLMNVSPSPRGKYPAKTKGSKYPKCCFGPLGKQ